MQQICGCYRAVAGGGGPRKGKVTDGAIRTRCKTVLQDMRALSQAV